ncbi:MAG: nucleotidyltransferase domain-containing protein [Candidatus Zixiibacteriota bacterium]|nr:MAG: nucleotidyltransferase domain-containing protein [candidate division Zixibacteria bacterium]
MAALNPEIVRRAIEAVPAFQKHGTVRAVYLFGSHVEGRADQWSDIDLAVFMDGIEAWDLDQRVHMVVQVQNQVGYDVEPHLFAASNLVRLEKGSFAEDIIKRGVRIWGEESVTSG